ncbi:hypothetical protein [Streptomyces sp. NPDC029041]|uniref:hypothetical protein n=1 Tax=Streptomyces sp. NPDC029041 TaxID=3155727 RepID=UPI0033C57F26
MTAAVLFLVSSDTRSWLREHYMSLAIAGLALVAIVLTLSNILVSQKSKISDLEARLAEPSTHDADMFQAINQRASPQSDLLVWLRNGFLVTSYEGSQLSLLDQFIEFCDRDPRGFDDAELNTMYKDLIQRFGTLRDRIGPNIFPVPHSSRYTIPPEWRDERPEVHHKAVQQISTAHDELLKAYDAFIVSAQRKRFRSHLEATN